MAKTRVIEVTEDCYIEVDGRQIVYIGNDLLMNGLDAPARLTKRGVEKLIVALTDLLREWTDAK